MYEWPFFSRQHRLSSLYRGGFLVLLCKLRWCSLIPFLINQLGLANFPRRPAMDTFHHWRSLLDLLLAFCFPQRAQQDEHVNTSTFFSGPLGRHTSGHQSRVFVRVFRNLTLKFNTLWNLECFVSDTVRGPDGMWYWLLDELITPLRKRWWFTKEQLHRWLIIMSVFPAL